ncbi:hypothetical protein ACFFJI_03890 [Allobacillus sp. GCM10007491]|uniref:Uncharacterized protein n=2 Tax=Allobacillus TaxID=1400133 RepID=A0A941CU81_9BACI|nr:MULTISPECIES: hypothetical protein [Allobacillus]MBR7553917.1 hypothetical protein [Allobacillus saliphilus]MBU6080825.1 hypothetical protein [Allobacillus halotolerans]
MKKGILIIFFLIAIALLYSCNNEDTSDISFTIQEETHKDENILIQPTDLEELGFKPHYKIQIEVEDEFSSSVNLLGEELEYLRPVEHTATFDLIVDIDSPVNKNFRLMIWDSDRFLPIQVNDEEDDTKIYYDIDLPSGNHSISLTNLIEFEENFDFKEIAFIFLDKDAPVDTNLRYSPIRMHISNSDNLSLVETDNKDTYEEDSSLLEPSDLTSERAALELAILDHNKKKLNTIGITDQSHYISIEQVNTDVMEKVVFFNIEGEVYEEFTTKHPIGKKAIIPIPDEIIDNIGETDYYVLIDHNFGKSGLKKIKNIMQGSAEPFANYSYIYKIGAAD